MPIAMVARLSSHGGADTRVSTAAAKRRAELEDQGGTGVKGSAQSEGATNKNSAINPSSGAGSSQAGGPSTGLEPGTGIEDSAQGEGATAKQGKPDMKEGKLPPRARPTNPRACGVRSKAASPGRRLCFT